MIEPLRYHIEKCPPFAVPKPVFCQRCLSNKKTKDNPKLVIKYCPSCPRCQLLCQECDAYAHSFVKTKDHIRRIVVVGPGVRKKIHQRGDSRSFPQLFDIVEIKFKAKIIHNGKVVHRTPLHHLAYPSGMSGQCVHVQILGAKRLPIADAHGSSDPFICISFGGKRIGTTRTRPRTINPRWSNETYVIPITGDEEFHGGGPHGITSPTKKKSENLIKFEVFDRDYFNFNDFLGHVEVTKQQLYKLAHASNQKPIRLSLGLREYHGRLGLQFGINANLCYLKVLKAESLDKMDAIGLSDPFCEVYFKETKLGRTNVCSNTLDPVWTSGNLFTFDVIEVLKEEIRLRALARLGQGHRLTSKSNEIVENANLFRIELFDYNSFRSHAPLGTIKITCDSFRRLAPSFPRSLQEVETGKSINHLLHTVRKASISISSLNPLSFGTTAVAGAAAEVARGATAGAGTGGENDEQQQQQSESFKLKLAEIEKLDHIEEDDESVSGTGTGTGAGVDPSIADEDEEISRKEPKEPTFEFETDYPEVGLRQRQRQGDEAEEEEREGQQQASQSQIPFLNITRRRNLLSSEQESLGSSSRHSKRIEEEESEEEGQEREEENEKSDELDSLVINPTAAIYQRTGRSVTPRVTHNLPSYDSDDGGMRDRMQSKEFSTNQEDEDDGEGSEEEEEEESEANESKPLVSASSEDTTNDFLEEDPDEEVPSFLDRMKENYENLKTLTAEKYRQLFPPAPAEPSNRRQSLIEILSKQRKSILDVTVGSTQWFPMKWFDIQKRLEDIVDAENEDRGQLIVRLIPSMRGHVVRGLDVGVRHMTIGERSTVKVRYDYAYGNFWMGPEIPPRSNINFTVQLLSINGSGHILQIPWRLWLRFYRMMRRNSRRARNGSIEFYHGSIECWRALMTAYHDYRYGKLKIDEEEESVEEIEEEEYDDTLEKEESSEESDDDDFNVNDFNRGIIAGAGAMWGYDPKKRPKKIKKRKKPKQNDKSVGSSTNGDLTSRSRMSQQSKVSMASSSTNKTTTRSTTHHSHTHSHHQRRLSKQSQMSSKSRGSEQQDEQDQEDEDEIEFQHDDSASESSRHSRDSFSGTTSSYSTMKRKNQRKEKPIDENGRRQSTQQGKKNLSKAPAKRNR